MFMRTCAKFQRRHTEKVREELCYWKKKPQKLSNSAPCWLLELITREAEVLISTDGFNSLDHLVWLVVPFPLLFTNLWIKLKEKMSVDDFSIILRLHSKADADFEIQRFQSNFFKLSCRSITQKLTEVVVLQWNKWPTSDITINVKQNQWMKRACIQHGSNQKLQQVSKLSLTMCQCFHLSRDTKNIGKEVRWRERQQINMQETG